MESAKLETELYIVDDDPSVREALSSLLRANGKRVRLFTSGRNSSISGGKTRPPCLIARSENAGDEWPWKSRASFRQESP